MRGFFQHFSRLRTESTSSFFPQCEQKATLNVNFLTEIAALAFYYAAVAIFYGICRSNWPKARFGRFKSEAIA
jgi:hypothetical protein